MNVKEELIKLIEAACAEGDKGVYHNPNLLADLLRLVEDYDKNYDRHDDLWDKIQGMYEL